MKKIQLGKFAKRIVSSFIASPALRASIRKGNFENYKQAKSFLKKEHNGKLKIKDDIAIIAMIRDEGCYLAEWIEYHRLVGVTKFYIFDNESKDNTKEVLEPYIKSGIVKYQFLSDSELEGLKNKFKEKRKAHVAHWLGIEQARQTAQWVTIIDVDEFILPKTYGTIPNFMAQFPRGVNQVILGWDIYGNNGHKTKPDGLVIENYTSKGKLKTIFNFKSIVNPRAIVIDNNHYHHVIGKTVDENGKILRRHMHEYQAPSNICPINHYIVRSLAECEAKCAKNQAINHENRYSAKDYFNKYNLNETEDNFITKYADEIKKSLKLKK